MSCRLKHLAVAAAIVGLATQVQAGYFPGSTDFENDNLSQYWSAIGDASIETEATPAGGRATYRPSWFTTTNKVLSVDNDVDSPIVCDLGGEAATIYADVLVKGYPLASDAPYPEVGPTDKILVYTRANGSATNLCVYAKETAASIATNEYVLTSIDNGWHRIIIKAANGAYQVYCDDATTPCATAGSVDTFYPINALTAGDAVISSVAFAGSGSVDDLILTDFIPEQPVHTITWPTSLASVSYTVDGVAGDALTAGDGQYQFQAAQGSAIVVTGNNGYVDLTANGTIGAGAATIALVEPAGIAKYTNGDGTEQNPYEIPCYEALVEMKDLVASNATARSAYYIQTEDIDCTGKAAFAGIGGYNATPTGGTPFSGTYDGQGYTISNITMTARNYGGIFNQVNGGTIKNLTVENISVENGATGEYGFAIIGNAGNGATLTNLVATGSFLSAENPGTHNMAGIVVRASAGGTGTLVKDCTNNAAIYGNYTKMAGICALTQYKLSGGAVTFDGCVNNGTLTSARTAEANAASEITGIAGIVAYTADVTVLKDCVNNGTITVALANQKVGELVGSGGVETNGSLTDDGGNKADATKKMVYNRAKVTGFQYATVDNGVATTIAPPYTLAANETYLLEGNVAASETPVATLTAVGDTIAFDTALGYTFAGTVAGQAPAGYPVASTSGTVTTYTAGYFPRTATPGQDGSAAHPFEIADVDDLQALKAAFAAAASWRSLSYKVVADIDATTLGYWEGISSAASSVNDTGLCGGTFDGDGHTISVKFTPAKYRGFFNHVNNHATIKNLTINVTDIEETSMAEHGYGAFVGNIANATLLNCVATGTIGTTDKPAMHTCGGFAVKVVNGVFVNCTNHADIVCSLTDNPKIGGIIGLSFQGSSLTNCYNDGTMTITLKQCGDASNGAGGLIGLAQSNPVKIHNCGNAGTIQSTDTTAYTGSEPKDVKVGTIIGMSASAVTVTGGTIAQADAASAGARANITGLDFATVDNNVATFAETLASNNTYKVMLSGATATYEFAAPGTIAFDTALATPTYAITVADSNTLALTDATSGTVTTYTASTKMYTVTFTWYDGAMTNDYEYGTLAGDVVRPRTPAGYVDNGTTYTFTDWSPAVANVTADADYVAQYQAVVAAYPDYLENADADVKANYDAWKATNGADTESAYENQFLVNAAPATAVPANALAITAIEQNATAGWDITVECTVSGVDLTGEVGTPKAGNGYLAISYASDLSGTWTTENINITASANGKVTVNVNKSGAKFMKVKLSATAEPVAQP